MRTILFSILLFCTLSVWSQDKFFEDLKQSIRYDKHVPQENSGSGGSGSFEIGPLNGGSGSVSSGRAVQGGPAHKSNAPTKELYDDFEYDPDFVPDEDAETLSDIEKYSKDGGKAMDSKKNPFKKDNKSARDSDNKDTDKPDVLIDDREESVNKSQGSANLFMILGIIVAAILIAYIIYRVIQSKNTSGDSKISSVLHGGDVSPEEISKTELELALEKAVKNGDYRAAIRVYFTFIMKDLFEKRLIIWEKEKTNLQYLRELSSSPYHRDFSTCVNIFEVVWYGKRPITESEFITLSANFKKLLNELGVK